MKKISLLKVFSFLLILSIGLQLTSCKYYKYKNIPSDRLSKTIQSKGRYSPLRNHYVIHFGDKKLELKDVVIDSKMKTITGKSIPFEGLPSEYYNQIQLGKSKRRASKPGHIKAVKQIHIYFNENKDAGELNSLNLNFNDILKIEVVENDIDKSAAVALGVTVLVFITVGAISAILLNNFYSQI